MRILVTISTAFAIMVLATAANAWPTCSRNPTLQDWTCISPDYNPPASLTNGTAMTADALAPWQWAMRDVLENEPYENLFSDMTREVKVAVIDLYTGHQNHPDLVNRYETGINVVEGGTNTNPPTADDRTATAHGQCVASIIAAEHNDIGMAGVCKTCKIIPVRASFETLDEAISEAVDAGAEVIHIAGWEAPDPQATFPYVGYNDLVMYPELAIASWYPVRWSLRDPVTMAYETERVQAIRGAIQDATWNHNVIISGVVGNQNGFGVQHMIASHPEVISTLATNILGEVSPFNNHSYSATVLAPGGDRREWPNAGDTDYPSSVTVTTGAGTNGDDILCAVGNGGYVTWSGGSFAGPHAAGAMAIIRSYLPNADTRTVRRLLWQARQPIASNLHLLTASMDGRLSLKRLKAAIDAELQAQ